MTSHSLIPLAQSNPEPPPSFVDDYLEGLAVVQDPLCVGTPGVVLGDGFPERLDIAAEILEAFRWNLVERDAAAALDPMCWWAATNRLLHIAEVNYRLPKPSSLRAERYHLDVVQKLPDGQGASSRRRLKFNAKTVESPDAPTKDQQGRLIPINMKVTGQISMRNG